MGQNKHKENVLHVSTSKVMAREKTKRQRGVVLTNSGWYKLEAAIRQSAMPESAFDRYTFKVLSDRTGLSSRTITKVLDRKLGVDKRSLEQFFAAFNIKLCASDYTQPEWGWFGGSQGAILKRRFDLLSCVDVSVFYNRTQELAVLEHWLLQDCCRLVAVVGMGGIGKTALVAKLVELIKQQFEIVIWRSLGNAPPLSELLDSLLGFLDDEPKTQTAQPLTVAGKILRLMDYFHSSRCLLVLDNAEAILQSGSRSRAGCYREGYADYGLLLQHVGEVCHHSCLVLTSRELPKEFIALSGESLPVRSSQLTGLDLATARVIFNHKGNFSGSESEWKVLIEHYTGNPLALKIVATRIQELFGGRIGAYLELKQQGNLVFDDIRDLLEQQFNRLSELEQDVIYWLAIEREPMAVLELQENLVSPVSASKIIAALSSLGQRYLIERSTAGWTLQPVVMEYVTERLIEQVCQEITTQQLARFQSHALMKAQALDYVRSTQVRLILKPVLEGLLCALGSNGRIENQLTQILATLQKTAILEPGYTGGNVLNLLAQLGTDLQGLDFSHLTVWQADLRHVELQQVSFAHADLGLSVFMEPSV